MLVFLLLPVVAAAGLLFVRYKLESFRDAVAEKAQERLGLRFGAEDVEVNGLRGLRVKGFDAMFTTPLGPRLRVEAPETFIDIDLIDLVYGQMTVERIQVEGATFTLSREKDRPWFHAPGLKRTISPAALSFRVTGRHCTLRVLGRDEDAPLNVRELAFDVSRLPQSPDTIGRIYGALDGAAENAVRATFRYGSVEDFDLRVSAQSLGTGDVNALLPEGLRLHADGAIMPNARLSGYPDRTLVLSLDAPFSDLALEGATALPPVSGNLTALAGYQLDTRELRLNSARLDTEELSGEVTGSVRLGTAPPSLDLRLALEEFPLRELTLQATQAAIGPHGTIALELPEPYRLTLSVRGTLDTPLITAEAELERGRVTFESEDPKFPSADLEIGMLGLVWNNALRRPVGTLNITGGTLRFNALDLTAESVAGTLALEPGMARLDPLTAMVKGNELSGNLGLDLGSKTADFAVNGVLAGVEQFPILQDLGKARVEGDVHVRCAGTATQDRVQADLTVDLTQADVEYDWFFLKPRGMGASVRDLHVDLKPKQALQLTGNLSAATTTVPFDASLAYRGGSWRPLEINASSDAVNVLTTSECLRLPYGFSGAYATEGSFSWRPSPTATKATEGIVTTSVFFPQVTMQADEDIDPIVCTNAQLTSVFDAGLEPKTSTLTIHAESAKVPPLASPWLPPFRPPNEDLDARFPRNPLVTQYELHAGHIVLPPWEGTDFEGRGHFTPEDSAIDYFAADIEGGGHLEGSYSVEREHNIGALNVALTGIPATYLIRHMKFPELLTGTMTGTVEYAMDRDDPSTLEGNGHIDIRDGQFSADFVMQQLQSQLEADMSALPPSLAFDQLTADILFEGDKITTSNIVLSSEGIQVSGGGYFILEGDMDYMIDVSVAPETAARIPVLAHNLNVSGHRATQTDIKLAFHITGPTFSPSGRVAGLPPVGVTLVNGAFSVGGEVVKIIDTPRQILIDLFKIIGGAVGAAKPSGGRN